MIYLLVNNDYQLFDARSHAQTLAAFGVVPTLIEVPHTLHEADRSQGFAHVLTLPSPSRGYGWLGAWLRYFATARQVRCALQPRDDDVLFMYTEFELLNQFVALQFKRAGARVYLIEDGGVGTYLPFSLPGSEPLSFKEHVIALMSRCLPGLAHTRFHKLNGVVFPWLPDRQLDGVCLYRPVKIIRDLPVIVLSRARAVPVKRQCGRVIFLNERMYDNYQSDTQYLVGLQRLLTLLTQGFDEVLFKFHPRETAVWRERIRARLAAQLPSVRIVASDRAMEAVIDELRPEAIASYFSTALLNLDGTGVEPMFLYQMLPELAAQKVFVQLTTLLTQWGYRFVRVDAEARSGYVSGLNDSGSTPCTGLADLVADGAHRPE